MASVCAATLLADGAGMAFVPSQGAPPSPPASPPPEPEAEASEQRHRPGDRAYRARAAVREGLLGALPWLLLLFYLVFPMVSSLAFRAFDCEEFDGGRRFLRSDYGVDCDTAEYDELLQVAWVAIFCYPIVVPTTYVLLLMRARHAILSRQVRRLPHPPTSLLRAWRLTLPRPRERRRASSPARCTSGTSSRGAQR